MRSRACTQGTQAACLAGGPHRPARCSAKAAPHHEHSTPCIEARSRGLHARFKVLRRILKHSPVCLAAHPYIWASRGVLLGVQLCSP